MLNRISSSTFLVVGGGLSQFIWKDQVSVIKKSESTRASLFIESSCNRFQASLIIHNPTFIVVGQTYDGAKNSHKLKKRDSIEMNMWR